MLDVYKDAKDEELVARARAGEAEAFGVLMERHQPAVTGLLTALLRDLAAAEDASQQAFVNAFRRLDGFEGRASFKTWVTRIALNEARSALRARRLRRWLPLGGPREADGADGRRGLDELLAGADDREALEGRIELDRAMEALSPREREMSTLRLEGYKLSEIAETLGVGTGTVKSTLFEATRKLRRRLT